MVKFYIDEIFHSRNLPYLLSLLITKLQSIIFKMRNVPLKLNLEGTETS